MKRRIKVVCAVIEREGTILAARRKIGQSNGGLWEFPGGKVRRGEKDSEALRREIREELCVEVDVAERLSSVNWDYPGFPVELIPFKCTIVDNAVPLSLEHEEVGFFTPQKALSLEWTPPDRVVVEKYLATRPLEDYNEQQASCMIRK